MTDSADKAPNAGAPEASSPARPQTAQKAPRQDQQKEQQQETPTDTKPQDALTSPEVFRLRADLPKVMRLSRKTLAIAGTVAGCVIGGALIYALQPIDREQAPNLYDGASQNRVEAVTSAPADYAQAPKLGPPLPGDLGRPILAAREAGKDVPAPAMGVEAKRSPRAIAEQQARERERQEHDSARTSALFAGNPRSGSTPAQSAMMRNVSASMGETANSKQPLPAPAASDGQDRKRAFLKADRDRRFVSTERVSPPFSAYVLQAGSVIPAALITAIRSDLPGTITAQVTQNVYDSATGRLLLIPQGSRLIGEYDSSVSAGQRRVLLAWDRLIVPGGRSIALDRQPGTDPAGAAGLEDRTNHHWGSVFKAALISTLLGVGTELTTNSDDELARALRYGTQGTINQAGQQIVGREINIAPTLAIRPGFPLRVLVTHDLVIEPAPERDLP